MTSIPVHNLLPFYSAAHPFRLEAGVVRNGARLQARFAVEGDASGILFPASVAAPGRADRLWDSTCFEIFLKPDGTEAYWEFNFAPSGQWAVYRFYSYRCGMAMEEGVSRVHVRLGTQNGTRREWDVDVDLSGVPELAGSVWCVGLTAVIAGKGGEKTYWAAKHCGEKPDFHLADSFCVKIL